MSTSSQRLDNISADLGLTLKLTSVRHHPAMQALFVAWYNLSRTHETSKGKTLAMARGLSEHVWTIKELIAMAAEA